MENLEIITIFIVLLLGYLVITNNSIIETFENKDYKEQIIAEKLSKYDSVCDKATPVLASHDTLQNVDRKDYMEVLKTYNKNSELLHNELSEQMMNTTQKLTELEILGETTMDKLKRTLDNMDLQDRASNYFFLKHQLDQ